MATVKHPVAVVSVFLWTGFVCAISFMEAWLKFRAPGINLPLGLGIGRLVFSALNKVEWVLAISILLNFLLSRNKETNWSYLLFATAFIILIIQTFYALPALDIRAQQHIDGLPVQPSNLHFLYIAFELVKVVSLFIFGLKLFR